MVKYSKGKFYVMPMLTHYGKHADLHPTTYATVHVKERTTVDLKAGYGNLALEIANVFDDDYERPLGYNQGGQQLKLTYSWKFQYILYAIYSMAPLSNYFSDGYQFRHRLLSGET